MKVLEIAHHRNGVRGKPFYAVRFTDKVVGGEKEFLGVVPSPENSDPGECYVVCLDLIPSVGVAFGHNSWRGDHYADRLRTAIADMNAEERNNV
jgi:hypothetical protein